VRADLARFGRVVTPDLPSAPARALELLDSTISPGAIVVAHSMGAVLAMRVAKTRPRPLRAAILTGCFFPPARNGRTRGAAVADYAAHRVAFVRASRGRRTQRASRGSVAPLASMLRLALRPAGLEEALARVTSSVLIIHARDDHHVPVDYAIAAQRRRQDWALEVLDHGGHHAHVTRPVAWSFLAARWLAPVTADR
jgi:pimeloyl-ACP methyl ester carboxylesterase